MTGAVMAEEIRLPDPGTRLAEGSEDAPADRLLGIALRVLATLGLLPLLLLLGIATGVAIPLGRLAAACQGVVRPGARPHRLRGRMPAPDQFGPRR
jgi:hypothetical protein